jgi:hypothetical protein
MSEIAMNKLVNVIKKMNGNSNRPDTMIFGVIKSVDPLEIDIGNNITLTKEFLFLGQMCRPHKVTIPHTHIIDTHFTEKSPSIGSVGAGLTGMAYEQTQSAVAKATMNSYTTLDDDGNEVQNQISDEDLGRGSISTSIVFAGSGSLTDNSVTITDNKHQHIIDRQITKDVHFPQSDYEESVTIEIEPKLKEGDTVLMFAFNNYQYYYVAERIEEAE